MNPQDVIFDDAAFDPLASTGPLADRLRQLLQRSWLGCSLTGEPDAKASLLAQRLAAAPAIGHIASPPVPEQPDVASTAGGDAVVAKDDLFALIHGGGGGSNGCAAGSAGSGGEGGGAHGASASAAASSEPLVSQLLGCLLEMYNVRCIRLLLAFLCPDSAVPQPAIDRSWCLNTQAKPRFAKALAAAGFHEFFYSVI